MLTIRPLLAFDAPHEHLHVGCFLASELMAAGVSVHEDDSLELVLHAAGYRLLEVDGVAPDGVSMDLEGLAPRGDTQKRVVCVICGGAEPS